MNTARTCFFPFSASQYQELEHQVLIFKQMASGIPIPSDLLYAALDSSVSSELLLHRPHHFGSWSYSQMGTAGRKIDPEPGRCRRTDGKKWRCAKEAYIDSKYCERHMHRSKNRSRKPVESTTAVQTSTALPFSSINRNTTNLSPSSPTFQSFSSHTQNQSIQHPYGLYNYHSSGSPKKSHFSSQDNNTTATKFMLESDPYSYAPKQSCSRQGAKMKVDEQPFLSETSGTIRSSNISGTPMHDSSCLLTPLTMGSPASYVKQTSYSEVTNGGTLLQLTEREDEQSNKVMHHFFDKQNERNSWHHNNDDNLSSNAAASSNIQLSISIPISSHDFFLTRENEK